MNSWVFQAPTAKAMKQTWAQRSIAKLANQYTAEVLKLQVKEQDMQNQGCSQQSTGKYVEGGTI